MAEHLLPPKTFQKIQTALISYLITSHDSHTNQAKRIVTYILYHLNPATENAFDLNGPWVPYVIVLNQAERFEEPVKLYLDHLAKSNLKYAEVVKLIMEDVLNRLTPDDLQVISETQQTPYSKIDQANLALLSSTTVRRIPFPRIHQSISSVLSIIDPKWFSGPQSVMLDSRVLLHDPDFKHILDSLTASDALHLRSLMESFRPLTKEVIEHNRLPPFTAPRTSNTAAFQYNEQHKALLPTEIDLEEFRLEYLHRVRKMHHQVRGTNLAKFFNSRKPLIILAAKEKSTTNYFELTSVLVENPDVFRSTFEQALFLQPVVHRPYTDEIVVSTSLPTTQSTAAQALSNIHIETTIKHWFQTNIWIEHPIIEKPTTNNVGFAFIPSLWLQDTVAKILVIRAAVLYHYINRQKHIKSVPKAFEVTGILIQDDNIGSIGYSATAQTTLRASIRYLMDLEINGFAAPFQAFMNDARMQPLLDKLSQNIPIDEAPNLADILTSISESSPRLLNEAIATARIALPSNIKLKVVVKREIEWICDDYYQFKHLAAREPFDADVALEQMTHLAEWIVSSGIDRSLQAFEKERDEEEQEVPTPSEAPFQEPPPTTTTTTTTTTSSSTHAGEYQHTCLPTEKPGILTISKNKLKKLKHSMPFVDHIPLELRTEFALFRIDSEWIESQPWFHELENAYFPNDICSKNYVIASMQCFRPLVDPTLPIPHFPYNILPKSQLQYFPRITKGDTAKFVLDYKSTMTRLLRGSEKRGGEEGTTIPPSKDVMGQLLAALQTITVLFARDNTSHRNLIEFSSKTIEKRDVNDTYRELLDWMNSLHDSHWIAYSSLPTLSAQTRVFDTRPEYQITASLHDWFSGNIWVENNIESVDQTLAPTLGRNVIMSRELQQTILLALAYRMAFLYLLHRFTFQAAKTMSITNEGFRAIIANKMTDNELAPHMVSKNLGRILMGWLPTMQSEIIADVQAQMMVHISAEQSMKLYDLTIAPTNKPMTPLYSAFIKDFDESETLYGGNHAAAVVLQTTPSVLEMFSWIHKNAPKDVEVTVNLFSQVENVRAIPLASANRAEENPHHRAARITKEIQTLLAHSNETAAHLESLRSSSSESSSSSSNASEQGRRKKKSKPKK